MSAITRGLSGLVTSLAATVMFSSASYAGEAPPQPGNRTEQREGSGKKETVEDKIRGLEKKEDKTGQEFYDLSELYRQNNQSDRVQRTLTSACSALEAELQKTATAPGYDKLADWHGRIGEARKEDVARTRVIELLKDKDDKTADDYILLAENYFHKNENDKAGTAAREAVRLAPKNSKAHNELGVFHYDSKDYTKAEQDYRTAIRLDATNSMAHNNLGLLLLDQKKYDEARRELETAIRLEPNNGMAHINLGRIYHRQKNYREAVDKYLTAIRINPNNASAHNNLGATYHAQGKKREALREFRRTLEIDPDHKTAKAWVRYLNK